MVIYACLVQWIYKGFTAGKMTDVMAIWYAYAIYTLVFAAVRSGIVGVFKVTLIVSLPFLILCWLPNFRLGPARSPQALE